MLQHWFKRPRAQTQAPTQPDDLSALRQVYLTLFDVQRAHALLDVCVEGVEGRYQSIILGVDPEAGTVTIDELFPRGFIGLPGQSLTVNVRLDGSRRLSFVTHIIERRRGADAVELYQLMMPQTLDYNQRRGAFRLKLGQGWAMVSEFRAADRQRRVAAVRDLSSTGIRLALPDGLAEPLNEGDTLDNLQFEFAGRNFQCRADVRNIGRDEAGGTVIGAAFRGLSRLEQRSLERMIMQVQRQQAQQSTAVAR